jgi:hypothetical protein
MMETTTQIHVCRLVLKMPPRTHDHMVLEMAAWTYHHMEVERVTQIRSRRLLFETSAQKHDRMALEMAS